MTYRGKKLRSAPRGHHNRPPGMSRFRPLCVMTCRGKTLRSAPPGPRHRPPGTPRCWTLCFMTYRHEKLRCTPPGTRHRSNKFAYEPSILAFLQIVLGQNRTIDKININVLFLNTFSFKKICSVPDRSSYILNEFSSWTELFTFFANRSCSEQNSR